MSARPTRAKSARRKPGRRTKHTAQQEPDRPVLDVEIHFGTYITQHVAIPGPTTPLKPGCAPTSDRHRR